MPQAVVTFRLIRVHYAGTPTIRGLIEGITPTYASDRRFERSHVRNKRLRDWADGKGSIQFRKFEFTRAGPAVEPNVLLPDTILRYERALVTIAYPILPALYGSEDLDSMEDLIREDARQVRDVLLDPDNLQDGVSAVLPTILEPERDESVWFQGIDCELIYYEGQTFV